MRLVVGAWGIKPQTTRFTNRSWRPLQLRRAVADGPFEPGAGHVIIAQRLDLGRARFGQGGLRAQYVQAYETGERVSLAAAQSVVDLMQGRTPRNLLNREVLRA